MGKFDKQLKYSIRKVSVGAASVVIGAFYLAMGAGVVHADTSSTSSNNDSSHSSPSPEPETSQPNSLAASNYGAEPAQNPGVSGKSTESTTPKEKENNETLNAAQPTETSTSANNRGRRSKRDVENPPAGETSGNSTGTETPAGSSTENNETLNSALTERKGATVQTDQPGINIPKGDDPGADDPNAHLSFNDPGHTVTVEEMWKIIQNMPDDFQNNERSYLRNMDTLGDSLRFDGNGNVTNDPNGKKLQPGEIREISSFGGWTAIMKKDGTTGKFAVGMKNKEGYFTGWYTDKDGHRQEGGMLGSDALDRIYLHEQALDRRFKYMLMLAKGRTIANKDDKAQDGSRFDIVTANSAENKANLASLPVKDREDILQHAPNIEGFNGIEKTFTAFSTAYGSRLKIEFVTGYISDFEGSKGTYRIVVKAIKKDHSEETVYDHTINRIDGVVENEERYSQGVDLSGVNRVIKNILKDEYDKKVNTLADAKYKEKYPSERRKDKEKLEPLKEEAKQELVKNGDVIYELPIDKDELREDTGKRRGKFKENLKIEASSYAKVANNLNNVLKRINDAEVKRNSPIWDTSSEKTLENPNLEKSKDPDRVFKLLDFILPTAKKIIYHADTDQLELVTDPDKVAKHRKELKDRLAAKEAELNTANEEKKIELNKEISALKSAIGSTNAYTYTEARNGSKEAKILGSFMKDKTKPNSTEISDAEYGKYHTNELAEKESDGLAKFTRYFVEKENVARSNVISDEKLSEIINTEISGDNDKLGKGGYFSTGDIPLGKDVVSYKVQVFAENEKRVGVNKQSPRLQYNLPILADFSIIQDTVGPSKELARRIISKSNLPEDKKKEIIEKINKSKKTSEIRSQLSGDVKVKYQDVSGNVLTLDNTKEHQKETDLGKKGEDGTYLAVDSGLRYTNYNVTDKKLNTITTSDGKQYILKRSLEDGTLDNGRLKTSAAESGTLSDSLATVTFVYEEYTPPATGKGLVHFKKQVSETTEALTGYDDITLSGNVGETFSPTDVDTRITALKNAGYEIVTNEFDTNSKTIDSTADVDGQDPSQVYNVVVREKVKTVTTPPTPDTPVDPDVPEGPKWPETGLKESDLKKEVTRTINYFKKETADGEKIADAQPTKIDKVLYKRTATYNLVSKTVTYSGWTATADDTHTATSFSPVKTPVLTGYVADFKEVTDAPAAPNENGEVTNMTREVVYTKLGSWVPKIPGKTPTPIPYPNDPKDPTKPKYPDYPTTPENPDGTPVNPGGETPGTPEKPKTPVIPYVEGYVPKIPTDPTTPVGEDNPLKPLVPIDSNDPKKGYKVPELPNDPKKDTVIEYKPNPQKILIKVVNVTTGEEVELPNEKLEFNGVSDQVVTSEDKGKVDKKIDSLQKRGYIVSTKNPITETTKYDTKDDSNQKEPTQTYKIIVNEPVTKDTEVRKVTRTIKYVKIDVQDGNEVRTELNTEKIKTKVDKVEFSRDTTTSLATGLTKIGAWDQETKELPKVNTPVLVGYIANVVSVENKSVSPDTESYEVTVEYRKIGSWVPNLPEGVTPPAGTDMTPKPYPNNPTDPTKPKDPEYPQPGTPVEPNTPVIPYVPGYTPKIPTDPTQPVDPNTNPLVPLTPVDPNHPENGYKVPPVPTTPGTNTDITYVADPQKAVVKVFNTTTGKEVELPAEKVSIDNGTTDSAIPTDSVTAKIADLEKRGYVVENKDLLNNQKFDNQKDPETGDPTQVFKLKVHEKVVEVTEPPTPNTPVDPNVPVEPNKPVDPTVPKWPAEGLKESDLKKEVTRTITYVKKETPNGEEVASGKDPVTQTAHFTRKASYNVVTGAITYGNWESTDKELAKVDTPTLTGYVADKASVDKVVTDENSTGLDQKVVYTKLGSWVPNLPEGVKPPTGTDMTPKPYPNNPTDPTKPGTPVYPEPGQPITPGTPVIPYVPGYTPKTPDGNPLVPVDPEHPENGYKVPPVPTTPGTNTDITYVADPQKAVVKVFNTTTGKEVELPAEKVSIDNGTTDSAIPTDSVTAKIADLEKRGYVVENKDLLKDQKFDKEKDPTDGDPTQVFKLLVKERTVTVTEPKNPNDPVDPDKPEGPKWPATGLAKSDLEKEVTRTITYVKKETADGPEIADAKPTKKQTAHFKRSATYNLVTKVVTPGEWTSTDKTLEAVPTEKLDGYVANVSSVEEVETNVNSTNLDRKVVYTKLGSWIPKVPGVETPTPLPYPNHPTDPTKPGDPTDPNTPNVPVIPYVPGYTPKIGETPLQPKVPNDPTQGYIPPAVPTEPGTNTDITYVADPQKAVVKVFNTTTGKEVELPAEKVSIDNGTTDSAIPTDSVTAKIADLEKRGYVVENKDLLKDQKFDKEKDPTDGDPTQVFKLLVKERTVTVTEPPTPDTPVDPNVPEGPKWPESGLKESDLKKEVTRTITYVKKETANGPEEPSGKDPVTQTAHFKRSATYNAVTGTITYGNWESADKELAKVDTPTLTGYVADKASVDKVETNADSTGLDQKVVYTKLGSWIPTPPAGVTPPTGTNFDPKPYPNHPTDPTKPGEPEYPQPGTPVEPNTPVIPYVPGYTPKTPDGNPLVPVDPEHPENGYKVPPVPTTPGEDTPITYEGNPQKALVKVVKVDGTTETPLPKDNVTINGKTGDQIPTESVTAKIAELEKRGYVIDNRDEVVNYINNKFDKDKDTEGQDPTQTVTLKVHEKVVPVTPPTDDKPLEPGKPIDPDTPVDPNNPNDPTIPRWTDELIKKLDVKKEVTRTINYVDETGNKVSEPSTDKVTFTREAKINVVTGEITYGDWKAVGGDTTFDKVSSPVVKGYILKDSAQKEVAERKGITPTVANQTIEVVYKKLGSWVPKVPGVETPTPLPYPNDPTDPTKPGDPTDPTTPNVPVIPYVPGYTPKTPDGNPLVPVDPNHPENGYKVPPVPTKPGEDTPIEYVKVPNTPSPEEPVKPTPESNHITIWVDENGKPLKPEKPGTHEPGNIPGYRYITTVTKDGVTIHKFEKITPVDPNNPVPQKPTTPIPTPQDSTIPTPESQIPTPNTPEATTPTSETNRREELPNTGTEANASLASAGIMTLLAGLGLGFFKKKEEDESE